MWPCGFWSSRTRSIGRAPQARPRGGGSLRRRGAQRRGRALDGRRDGYDAIVLDVMLPGTDGFEGVPPSARGRPLGARSDAHCARRGRGPRPGSRRRRRRLPDQAVLVRGAACPSTRALGDLRSSVRRSSRSATCGSTATRQVLATAARDRVVGEGVHLLETFMRRPGEVSLAISSSSTAGTGYENRSNVVDVYVRYLREKMSTGRSTPRLSRRCGRRLQVAPRMSRVPIRLRLTLAFASRWRSCSPRWVHFSTSAWALLDETIDENLQARAAELARSSPTTVRARRRRSG